MTPAQRREGWVALAMLPVGATVLVVSVGAIGLLLCLMVFLLATGATSLALWAWCAFSLAVGFWNMRAGIGLMSSFDWRPLPLTLLLSALVVAGWLALP